MSTSWILILMIWVLQTEGKTISFSESTCPGYYNVDSTSDIGLVWDGSRIGGMGEPANCNIEFMPVGGSNRVCVEVEDFHIEDCNVYVKYDYYYINKKTYGCSFTPSQYCGGEYSDVSIEVSVGPRSLSSTGKNSFRLKVYNPQQTSSHSWIFVLVGLTLGFIVCTIAIVLVCRRKWSAGTALRTSGIPNTRFVNCSDQMPFGYDVQQTPYPNQQLYPDQPPPSNPPPYSAQEPRECFPTLSNDMHQA